MSQIPAYTLQGPQQAPQPEGILGAPPVVEEQFVNEGAIQDPFASQTLFYEMTAEFLSAGNEFMAAAQSFKNTLSKKYDEKAEEAYTQFMQYEEAHGFEEAQNEFGVTTAKELYDKKIEKKKKEDRLDFKNWNIYSALKAGGLLP